MEQRLTAAIAVNGVMTFPGLASNWTAKFCEYTNSRHSGRFVADRFEYLSGYLWSRSGRQNTNASQLAIKVSAYLENGLSVRLVGHSNGANVILGALERLGWPQIDSLTLFAPACASDCEVSGLNNVRAEYPIQIFRGGKDLALWLARTEIGRRFGYGALGATGCVNLRDGVRVIEAEYEDYGHNDWFHDAERDKFFERALARFVLRTKAVEMVQEPEEDPPSP
jgi:pimeloyl-ACP methyl ester carboxylesterase